MSRHSLGTAPDAALATATLVDIGRAHASDLAGQPFATWLNRRGDEVGALSFSEVDRKARALAVHLCASFPALLQGSSDPRSTPTALVVAQPGLEFVIAFFGCMYAGVAAVPAYPRKRGESPERLCRIARDAGTRIVVTDRRSVADIESCEELIRLVDPIVVDDANDGFAQRWVRPRIDASSIAFVQYTSGSTGTPKGVHVSHGNLLSNQRTIARAMGHDRSTVGVSWLPLLHDMGLVGGLLQPFFLGARIILMSPTDFVCNPLGWLKAISTYRATSSGAPNFGYEHCLERISPQQREELDLSCWKVAFSGAEPVRAGTLQRFGRTFGPAGFRAKAWYPCYGMAESTLFVTGGSSQQAPRLLTIEKESLHRGRVKVLDEGALGNARARPGDQANEAVELVSCGDAHGGAEVRIVDEVTRRPCGENTVGEIWVSGPSVAQGYRNRHALSRATFEATLATDDGSDSMTTFLRTGDLGFLSAGELFVVGRSKDLIIVNGRNHHPQDIELSCQMAHPALRRFTAVAFSVERDVAERLVVVLCVKGLKESTLGDEEVRGVVREAVAAQHGVRIDDVVLTDARLPVTTSGKLQRRRCRELYLTGQLPARGNVDAREEPRSTRRGA